MHSGYCFVSLALHSMLHRVKSFSQFHLFLSLLITESIEHNQMHSLEQLLRALSYFSCSLSKFINHASCFLCLHQSLHSAYGDYPNNQFSHSENTSIDFNELFFTLFSILHSSIYRFLESKDSTGLNAVLSVFALYAETISSLVSHSISFISFVINQNGNSLLHGFQTTQDQNEIEQKVQNCWVYLNLSQLRDVLRLVFSCVSLCNFHSTSVLMCVHSFLLLNMLSVNLSEDLSNAMIQFTDFKPSIVIISSIEKYFHDKQFKEEYGYWSKGYGAALHGILSVIGGVCIPLMMYPRALSCLSLLVMQLFRWMISNSWNPIYYYVLSHLERLVHYAMIIHRKPLWVILPECIVADMVKALLATDEPFQQRVVTSLFNSSLTTSEWYSNVSSFVLPVYINLSDIPSIVNLSRAINHLDSVSSTINSLLKGDVCIYNILVYLLKHLGQESTQAWTLLFFLQGSFDDERIKTGSIQLPESSRLSIIQLIQQEGHQILWPLLYDCTDLIPHEKQMSEAALKSLYESASFLVFIVDCTNRTAFIRESNYSRSRFSISTFKSTKLSASTTSN